ncbi:MAG: Coenzyme F420 hydrogenase/dehydrogenase, beta subunit C-terminal domain [Planctomycetia bacterium]|nr:Coenzyme F420 hydrogenase/dehydrogenase, beta subunit C-terminal domain [Planctomycetia bacterium]
MKTDDLPLLTCTGCESCQNSCPRHAISMKEDKNGFLYPSIQQELCVDCHACQRACPLLEKNLPESDEISYPVTYAVKHKEKSVIKASTSGGFFTALSDYILQKNGVIFASAFDHDMNIRFTCAHNTQERNSQRGSKYVQSRVGNIFHEVEHHLKNDILTLFVGTPCQNAGLTRYLKTKNVKTDSLITCDFICHGVTSPLFWRAHVKDLEKKYHQKLIHYNFRHKWPVINTEITFQNHRKIRNAPDTVLYYHLFLQNYTLRPSCFSCPYTTPFRPTDFTMGDFWGIETVLPQFFDPRGVSLLLINTPKGNSLFQALKNSLHFKDVSFLAALKHQHSLRNPVNPPEDYDHFWESFRQNGFQGIKCFTLPQDGLILRIKKLYWTYLWKKNYAREQLKKIRGN